VAVWQNPNHSVTLQNCPAVQNAHTSKPQQAFDQKAKALQDNLNRFLAALVFQDHRMSVILSILALLTDFLPSLLHDQILATRGGADDPILRRHRQEFKVHRKRSYAEKTTLQEQKFERSNTNRLSPLGKPRLLALTCWILAGAAAASAASHYQRTNVVSDLNRKASTLDSKLINPWGIGSGTNSPWWVSDNGSGFLRSMTEWGSPFRLEMPCR